MRLKLGVSLVQHIIIRGVEIKSLSIMRLKQIIFPIELTTGHSRNQKPLNYEIETSDCPQIQRI